MEKVRLDIIGLSYSQNQSGAYALILEERDGYRKLPIIIGSFEAQSIAIELEQMTPQRPLTHDLFRSFAQLFEINIKEVIIYSLMDGIFYSQIVCHQNGQDYYLDARTSDAIAIGIRCHAPIFTTQDIIDMAGIEIEDDHNDNDTSIDLYNNMSPSSDYAVLSLNDLEQQLTSAIAKEEYELASKLRDEINRRTTS